MRLFSFACCCVVFLAGCNGQPDPPPKGDPPAGAGRFTHSAIHKTVAPWDGAAVHLYLAEKPLVERKPAAPYVLLQIYQGAERLSKQRVRVEGKESRQGSATWRQQEGKDTPLDWAEIDFEEIQKGKPVKGTYELAFPDGTKERGRFEAVWWAGESLGG